MQKNKTLDHLGQDILVTPFYRATTNSTVDLVLEPAQKIYPDDIADLAVARGGDCLRQALLLRLLTPQGSLASLGHAGYGSQLHELIGQENTDVNRLRARSLVLATVAQEKRIAEVLELKISPDAALPDRFHIHLTVEPVGSNDPISLGLEVDL